MITLSTMFTLLVFAGVILAIAFDLMDMVVVALLGVSVLMVFGIYNAEDIQIITRMSSGTIALLFGGMVVARTLQPTGIFETLSAYFLRFTKGSGKRFLLGLFLLVAPLCAILPNATTVILIAPVIVSTARRLDIDIVPPMVLTAIISNSAGLLTLVGDPATFIVGSGIGMSFSDYLQTVSLGGLLAVLVLIPFLPWLMRDIWHVQRQVPANLPLTPLRNPMLGVFELLVLLIMVNLFLFGEMIPEPVLPPAVAIIAATLALLVIHAIKVEPVDQVIRDVDWKTLIFLVCLFCLVEAIDKTGILQVVSQNLYTWFGRNLLIVSLALLVGVGIASGFLANIPIIAVMLVMVKGYLVEAEWVSEMALAPGFKDWPTDTLVVFVAMMFAGTLGGNATLIGASANVVSTGICAAQGRRVSFTQFFRYGMPLMIAQITVSALYVLGLYYW